MKHNDPVTTSTPSESARKRQLLDLAYGYVLNHGLADMSLRPLADAVGSSPRVLLYLFGSKDGLVQAILARARADELRMLDAVRDDPRPGGYDLARAGELVWHWLAAPEHRKLNTLWVEGYARSLGDGDGTADGTGPGAGPWTGFARRTVDDWLAVFAAAQAPEHRDTAAGTAERTLLLAVLRGALLDLLATGDTGRADAAVATHLDQLRTPSPDPTT